MSKQTAKEYLEEADQYLFKSITNLHIAKEQLEELDILWSDDEWNLVADIETEISNLIKVRLSIKKLL
jgi:hypothetical protein